MSNETKLLGVASSPHVSSPIGTRSLMMDVLIALVPALCAAVYFFGPRALIATVISVALSGATASSSTRPRPTATCPPPSPACCWPSSAP